MPGEITIDAVNAKLAKDVPLSKEETQFVMSLPPDGVASKEEETIDWGAAVNLDSNISVEAADKKKEIAEKAKEVGLPETATPEEITAAEIKANSPAVDSDKLERELLKPDGQEVLDDFSKREKAYFHQMRRDRKNRQSAEEERDQALFTIAQLKRKETVPAAAAEEDPLAELEGKDPTDFLTVAEVTKILKKITAAAPKKEVVSEKPAGPDPRHVRYLTMCDQEARAKYPEDYDHVMELTQEIITSNPGYLKKIQEATEAGENIAEVSYEIIKKDPEFLKLAEGAKVRVNARLAADKKKSENAKAEQLKTSKAQIAQDALEQNKNKIKTTGHLDGEGNAETETDKLDGLTLMDIYNMSPLEFARLPKKTRQAFLEKYG